VSNGPLVEHGAEGGGSAEVPQFAPAAVRILVAGLTKGEMGRVGGVRVGLHCFQMTSPFFQIVLVSGANCPRFQADALSL
jgi:hypothetical protein